MKNDNEIRFEVKFVPAGTGSAVWDDPDASRVVSRFLEPDRRHGPMVGIVHLGAVRPTPNVLRDVVLTVGEDVKAGRYGQFALVISSSDDATRAVIRDMAVAQDIAMFISESPNALDEAEPVGTLTMRDRDTMALVLQAGGTVTAMQLSSQLGIEATTAGNRLVSLHRKGYLQRVERPHPVGDLFIDPRSLRLERDSK